MKREQDMKLEDQLQFVDVLSPVASNLEKGLWKFDEEGRIIYSTYPPVNNGWNISVQTKDRDCIRWLHIIFQIYRLVPKPCFGCFKVVVMVKNLKQLFRIREIQERMGLPSKCGIETRTHVPRLYGAYWYAPLGCKLEVARRLFEQVKKELDLEWKEDAPPVILKRGCTEMELGWGPSEKWAYSPQDEQRWQLINASYAQVPTSDKEPMMKKTRTMLQWIDWARRHGDATVAEFGDLFRKPTEYSASNWGLEEKAKLEVLDGGLVEEGE